MLPRPRPLLLLLAALALLPGCAGDGDFPSLAQRPAERAYAEEAQGEPAPPPAVPAAPVVAERARALSEEARSGAAEFDTAYGAAAAAVKRAGPEGSDSWVEAQQALSRATAAQARTTRALADLDQFALARAGEGPLSPADSERLKAALAELQRLADDQAERVAALEASLRGG